MFGGWLDSDPPFVLGAARAFTAGTAGAALAAGQEFAAGLDAISGRWAPHLRAAVRAYNEALQALSAGPADASRAEAVWSGALLVNEQYRSFSREFCS